MGDSSTSDVLLEEIKTSPDEVVSALVKLRDKRAFAYLLRKLETDKWPEIKTGMTILR
jgi:hypothetical protein